MVARSPPKVKGKKTKKKPQRKKIIRGVSGKKPSKKLSKKTVKKLTKKPTKRLAKKTAKKKVIPELPIAKGKKAAAVKKKTAVAKKKLTARQRGAIQGHKTRRKKIRRKKKIQKDTRTRQIRAFPELAGVSKAYAQAIADIKKEIDDRIRTGGSQETIKREEEQAIGPPPPDETDAERIERITREAYERGEREGREAGKEAGRKEATEKLLQALSEPSTRRLFIDKSFVESEQSEILARLWLAADFGELEQEIDAVADEYDMDVSEVYDLYYSPEAA